MRFAIILALLTLAVTIDLPYQAHSFNDLDYFIRLLKKGTLSPDSGIKTFKIDLSPVSKASCLKHSSWNETINTCSYIDKYTEQICCLGFRGDASSTPIYNYDFNTSYEFVNMLTRKDVMPYLKRNNIFIAINFQYEDSQNNLTKTFLYEMMKTINTSALNVTICSGADNMILDYDFKCVIQGKCKNDSISKYISDSGIILQSGSYEPYHPHDVYKRYRNFNTFYKQVGKLCAQGFPSWVDKYPYPIIFWEPSNEQQIQYVAKTFFSEQCQRPPKHNTIAHLAMASNLEPEMFQTYFQNYETDFGLGKKYMFSHSSSPYLTTLNDGGKEWIILAFKSDLDNLSHIQLRDNTIENVVNEQTLNGNITALSGHLDKFLINLQNGSGLYSRIYNSNLELQNEWSLTDKYLLGNYFNGQVRYISKVSDTFYNYIVTADGKSAQTSACDLGFFPTGIAMSDILYIVGQKGGQIFLSYNCTASTVIGFGTSATVVSSGDSLQILISDGMCQSAILSNNNEMNKCNFYKYSEFKEITSVPKMINYVGGSIASFNALKNSTEPVTGCTPNLSAAKIANGVKPSHIVFNSNVLITAYEYVPLNRQPLITTLFCGASNYDKIQTGNNFIISWFNLATGANSNKQIVK